MRPAIAEQHTELETPEHTSRLQTRLGVVGCASAAAIAASIVLPPPHGAHETQQRTTAEYVAVVPPTQVIYADSVIGFTKTAQIDNIVAAADRVVADTLGETIDTNPYGRTTFAIEYKPGTKCPSARQLGEIAARYADSTPLFVLPADTNLCDSAKGATAYAYGDDYIVVRDGSVTLPIVTHEKGHILGLGHHGRIADPKYGCSPKNTPDIDKFVSGGAKIKQWRAPSGELEADPYAGCSSDMAFGVANPNIGRQYEPYNTLELHKLDPRAFPLDDVTDKRDVEYQLGTTPGETRGVMFDLSADHPLQKLEHGQNIQRVAVGLSRRGNIADLSIIAAGSDNMTYTLPIQSYLPEIDHTRGQVDVYRDQTTDIHITAQSTPDGVTTLRVERAR